jgi:hypothetical protein
VALVIGLSRFDPTRINGTCVLILRTGNSPGIVKLDFVAALQVNARVGALRQHELEFEVHVAVLQLAIDVSFGFVAEFVAKVVEEDSSAWFGIQ